MLFLISPRAGGHCRSTSSFRLLVIRQYQFVRDLFKEVFRFCLSWFSKRYRGNHVWRAIAGLACLHLPVVKYSKCQHLRCQIKLSKFNFCLSDNQKSHMVILGLKIRSQDTTNSSARDLLYWTTKINTANILRKNHIVSLKELQKIYLLFPSQENFWKMFQVKVEWTKYSSIIFRQIISILFQKVLVLLEQMFLDWIRGLSEIHFLSCWKCIFLPNSR